MQIYKRKAVPSASGSVTGSRCTDAKWNGGGPSEGNAFQEGRCFERRIVQDQGRVPKLSRSHFRVMVLYLCVRKPIRVQRFAICVVMGHDPPDELGRHCGGLYTVRPRTPMPSSVGEAFGDVCRKDWRFQMSPTCLVRSLSRSESEPRCRGTLCARTNNAGAEKGCLTYEAGLVRIVFPASFIAFFFSFFRPNLSRGR